MSDNTTHWQDLREFAAVDLTESFILSWQINATTLLIDIDLFLCPDHPFYEEPRPSEGACIRPAEIEFPDCLTLTADNAGDEPVDLNAVAAVLDAGKIHDLWRVGDGQYQISGEFGVVRIEADRPILRLKAMIG